MNFLGPDDTCPNCGHPDIPAEASDLTGAATYQCPRCSHVWTTAWSTEPRTDPRVREQQVLDPGRFSEPYGGSEGWGAYGDEPPW